MKNEIQKNPKTKTLDDLKGVNDTLMLANYSKSAREKLEFDSIIVEPSSSILILDSNRLASLTSFFI